MVGNFIDLTGGDLPAPLIARPSIKPIIVDLTGGPDEERAGGGAGAQGGPRDGGVGAQAGDRYDPTIMRGGSYPRILVQPCEFTNKKGWREMTAATYLWFMKGFGVGVFARKKVKKGQAVCIYGGILILVARCSRTKLPADQTAHMLSLQGLWVIDSRVTEEFPWEYYAHRTRCVGGFTNASMQPNCELEFIPPTDGVKQYVLEHGPRAPLPGETPVVALFRAKRDIERGEQLLWNYRCDSHPGSEGAEMVLKDPEPPGEDMW